MYFKNLIRKDGVALKVSLANVHLPVRLGHKNAKQLFAEPLNDQLCATGRGSVMDCSIRKRHSGQIIGVDLYLGLTDASKGGLRVVAQMLEALSAPCGSSIRLPDGTNDPLVFGRAEGLEVAVETQHLHDPDAGRDLVATCRDAINDLGVSRGWDERADHTRAYFYGENFEAMRDMVETILEDHPQYHGAYLKRLA